MATGRFTRDPHFHDGIVRASELEHVLQEKANAVATVARGLAPDDPSTAGRDLKGSIEGEVGLTSRGLVGRVNAMNFKALWWEGGHHHIGGGFRRQPFLVPALEQEVGPVEAADEVS